MVCVQPLRPTQPFTLSGMESEYQPKCGDAVWLGRKGRHGSFHLWQVKLCDHLLTRAIPERLRGELLMVKRYRNRHYTLL